MELKVTLETVTPLFMAGADTNGEAELRPPSIKGALRFWYRALDRAFPEVEPVAFGSTSTGQAAVLLRLLQAQSGQVGWNQPDRSGKPAYEVYNVGSGTHTINGIVYLGYPLNLQPNERKAIPAGRRLQLALRAHRERGTPEVRKAWVAALWCLAHLGGLGTRARRGLGSLRLNELVGWGQQTGRFGAAEALAEVNDDPALTLGPIEADDPLAWRNGLEQGLQVLRSWYAHRPAVTHPVLDHQSRILLVRDDPRGQEAQPGFPTWDGALDAAGRILQTYRQRNPAAEYAAISGFLHGGPPLTEVPSRAAFGLPLTFRASGERETLQVRRTDSDRQPSPLLLRVARIGARYYPLFVLLNSPYLDTLGPLTVGGAQRYFAQSPRDVLNDFLDNAVVPLAYPEVTP